ncbi:MAG: hypothetical protein SWH78_16080 [Thermodesulfobacteriota bacterium]|nr:hypothetical protein [Thermodesulfobacteriota bacterium]
MNAKQIQEAVDTWIVEEDLPAPAALRIIRRSDPDLSLSADEIIDRNEFIRCEFLKEHELLMQLPKQDQNNAFFVDDFEDSAFNTIDFCRMHPGRSFNKYAYRIKKVLEQVEDLAIMHSSISHEEGRNNTAERYETLVDNEFRDELLRLVQYYKRPASEESKRRLKRRIAELNRRILDCRKIWDQLAPPENWEP